MTTYKLTGVLEKGEFLFGENFGLQREFMLWANRADQCSHFFGGKGADFC